MQKMNVPFFYQLGARLNPVVELDLYQSTRMDVWIAAIQVKEFINTLFSSYSALHVCRATGEELLEAIAGIEQWFHGASAEDLDGIVRVDDFQFQDVVAKAKEFEAVLSAELGILATYHVTSKGAYSTDDLIERGDFVLSESVRARVPQEALEEMKQAARCLALDSPTASGFHMMRGLEAVLHRYYLSVCNPKSAKKLENWAAYLLALKKVAGEGADDENGDAPGLDPAKGDAQVRRAITFLYQVKDTRNNIMHPELVLSPDEAFGLLDVAKAAIIVMADRLPSR